MKKGSELTKSEKTSAAKPTHRKQTSEARQATVRQSDACPSVGRHVVMEGSHAIAEAVKLCAPKVIASYPITPQSVLC